MQNLEIYATANSTVATVRDSANAQTVAAPMLVIGISTSITLTLFAQADDLLPLPPSALSGITAWSFVFDDDFNSETDYKIVADSANITWTGATYDGEQDESGNYIPTVFNIPIPQMNSVALNEWLGTAASKSGLIGELVGYDSTGAFVFVLQIQGFTVRNRITGGGEIEEPEQAAEFLTLDAARAMFLSDNNALKPFIDIEITNTTSTTYTKLAGHYVLHEAYWFRAGLRRNVYFRDNDEGAFIEYSESLKAWVLYSVPTVGMPSATFSCPWIRVASNPGPIAGFWRLVSNPSSTIYARANITTRYNITAQTY